MGAGARPMRILALLLTRRSPVPPDYSIECWEGAFAAGRVRGGPGGAPRVRRVSRTEAGQPDAGSQTSPDPAGRGTDPAGPCRTLG